MPMTVWTTYKTYHPSPIKMCFELSMAGWIKTQNDKMKQNVTLTTNENLFVFVLDGGRVAALFRASGLCRVVGRSLIDEQIAVGSV